MFYDISKAFDRVLHKGLLFNPIALRKAKLYTILAFLGAIGLIKSNVALKGVFKNGFHSTFWEGVKWKGYTAINYIFTAISVEVIITNKLNIPKMMNGLV